MTILKERLIQDMDDNENIQEISARIIGCLENYRLNRTVKSDLFDDLAIVISASGLGSNLEISKEEMSYIRLALKQLEKDPEKADIESEEGLKLFLEMRNDMVREYMVSLEGGDELVPEILAIDSLHRNVDLDFVAHFSMMMAERLIYRRSD